MDPMYGGGNQQQMMSMSISSACLVACVAIAGGVFFMSRGNNNNNSGKSGSVSSGAAGGEIALSSTMTGTSAPVSGPLKEGLYNVVSGGVSMIVNPDNCTDTQVGFDDPQENDKHAWNLRPVNGRPGFYYIQSEHRLFKKGCDLSYLTAPSDCSGTAVLDRPVWADRQYWQLVPSGNGGYQLRNASCAAKRAPSYLTSSGVNKGFGVFQLHDRSGTTYSFNPTGPS